MRVPEGRRQLAHCHRDAGLHRVESPTRFWAKNERPSNSPDLNPLDYNAWRYIQAGVTKKRPACLDTLKLAATQAVGEMPLDMVQRALGSFPEGVELRIRKEGGAFKDTRRDGPPELMGPPSMDPAPGGGESDGENEN